MKTLNLNLTTLKFKLLLVGLISISGFLTSCDKEDVEPDAPPVTKNSKSDTDELVHQVSTAPILLDGVSAPPTDVLKFNGQPLIYFIDENFEKDGIVRIFTSEEKANTYKSQIDAKNKNSAAGISHAPGRCSLGVYDAPNYLGASTNFSADIPRLGTVGAGFWNNRISSVKNGNCWVRLYNGPNYTLNGYWIAPWTNIPNLPPAITNQASSINFN